LLTPTRFGLCPRLLQGVLDRFLQQIEMRPAVIDSKITIFAQQVKFVNKYSNMKLKMLKDKRFSILK